MKILLINYRYYRSGGPEQYMFNIKELLESNGHAVVPFSVRSNKNEPCLYESYFSRGRDAAGNASFASIKKTPKNVFQMVSSAFFNREVYKDLRRLINDTKPDVAYVLQQVNTLSPSVFKACKDEGLRVVHRLSDFNMMCPRFDFLRDGNVCTACIDGKYARAIKYRCCHNSLAVTVVRVASMKYHKMRRLFDCVDVFICPAQNTADLLRRSGVSAGRIRVIPTFAPLMLKEERKESLHENGYILYLGRISPEKGVADLIEAAIGRPSIRLIVAGPIDSDYASSLVAQVSNAGASDRIVFTGAVQGKEKENLIDGAICVCCPSKWLENFPNVVLEAYAHSKPVVSYDIGCMPELVQNGITGLVVQLGEKEDLANALALLIEDRDYASALGERGLGLIQTVYSSNAHLTRLLHELRGSANA